MLNLLTEELQAWELSGLTRLRVAQHNTGIFSQTDMGMLINFASNDYLGLSRHPAVIAAFKKGIDSYGLGSTASQMVCGYTYAHRDLEDALCDFTGMQRAILFPSGYMANMGVLSALANEKDIIFQDKLNHASLIDGARLSGAKQIRYAHCDMEHLRKRLSNTIARHKWIVSEGVFSMDGDIAPLPALFAQAKTHNTHLILDDAHAIGVIGEQGRGSLAYHCCQLPTSCLITGTFGKSIGLSGAFVAGDHAMIEYILQFARPYMFTTGLMPAIAVAACKALQIIQEGELTQQLQMLIAYFRQVAQQLDLPFLSSQTAIQPCIIGSPIQAMSIWKKLQAKNFWVGLMRPPTVLPNTSRLRISLSAIHTKTAIDQLLETLKEVITDE